MKKLSTLLAAGVMVATALVGCGAAPTAPEKPTRRQPAQQMQQLPQQGVGAQQAPLAGAAGDAQVKQLLAAVAATNQRATGFSATLDVFDKGATGSNTQTLKVAFKKPNNLKINIVKDAGGNEGVTALWAGSSKLQVKPKFPPVTVSLDVTDKRVTSQNGWTIKDTGVAAILNVLLNPQNQIKSLGNQVVNGKNLAMLEVKSPVSPSGATHEVIGIDPAVNLPAFRAVYKGQTVMYKLSIKSISMTAPTVAEMSL